MKRIKDILFRWSARLFLASLAVLIYAFATRRGSLLGWAFAVSLLSFAAVVFTGVRSNKDYLRSHGEDL